MQGTDDDELPRHDYYHDLDDCYVDRVDRGSPNEDTGSGDIGPNRMQAGHPSTTAIPPAAHTQPPPSASSRSSPPPVLHHPPPASVSFAAILAPAPSPTTAMPNVAPSQHPSARPPASPPSSTSPHVHGQLRPPSTSASTSGRTAATASPTMNTSPTAPNLPQQQPSPSSSRSASSSTPTTSAYLPVTVSAFTTSTSLDINPHNEQLDEEDDDHAQLLMPDAILPLLRCPLCPFSTLFEAPITLQCGHTVCSKHVIRPHPEHSPRSPSSATALLSSILASDESTPSSSAGPRCPLPICNRRGALDLQQPQVHPESGVNFRSAAAVDFSAHQLPAEDSIASRVDVTVNKIISLTARLHRSLSLPTNGLVPNVSDNEHDEGEAVHIRSDERGVSLADPSSISTATSLSSAATRRPRSRSRSVPPCTTSPSSPTHRPRKRRRLPSPSNNNGRNPPLGDCGLAMVPTNRRALSALFEKELLTELTCEICFALMWQPVTTPCQHTFCSQCLLRSMDHSSACPLCRQDLPAYVYSQERPCNKVVLSIILKAFPATYAERGAMIQAEERDARLDTPIFVCQLSFPGMPTMLHLFEPRYRLMLRRCLASPNPCFGMIPPPRPTSTPASPGNDFGTMLQIKSVQMLPDGRSIVETWGTWRFRIMERGMFDGYVVARVERVDDLEEVVYESDEVNVEDVLFDPVLPLPTLDSPASGSSSHVSSGLRSSIRSQPTRSSSSHSMRSRTMDVPSNEELMRICHEFLEQLREGTPWVVQHLDRHYVPMPSDPAQFSFWMTLLLPIDEHEKAKLLPIRSPRLRLRLVVHWIKQLRSHWANSYAAASRWQVVLWRVCGFVMRFVNPRSNRDRGLVFGAYVVLALAVVWAQVGIRRREVEQAGVV